MSNKLLLPLFLLSGLALATGPVDPATLAKARDLLKRSDERLAAAGTLRAVYNEIDAYPGEYRDLRQTGTVTLARPGNVRVEIVRARRIKASDLWKNSGNDTLGITDAKEAFSVFFHPHSTQVRAVEPAAGTKLAEAPLLAGFFGAAASPSAEFEKGMKASQIDDVSVSDSKVSYTIGSTERTVEVGSNGLVHRLEVRNAQTHVTRTWELESVELNPSLSPSVFTYKAPKDALPFPVAEHSDGIEDGMPAPDFEVPSFSNKPVWLSDYKGKVVLLEFWATWCWPCNQSIPEMDRLVTAYRDRGVSALLVSIKDSRKGFDAWVKKHPPFSQLTFAFDDPVHGSAYEAFLHPSNPTLYVIGKDGRVVARFEGYTGPNPAVRKAIESAL